MERTVSGTRPLLGPIFVLCVSPQCCARWHTELHSQVYVTLAWGWRIEMGLQGPQKSDVLVELAPLGEAKTDVAQMLPESQSRSLAHINRSKSSRGIPDKCQSQVQKGKQSHRADRMPRGRASKQREGCPSSHQEETPPTSPPPARTSASVRGSQRI